MHMMAPNGHLAMAIVTMRKGMPSRKHSSAMARLRMYMLVTVCILENRRTT